MVSIIVPIYKVEKYLAKCIESILSQTYKELELILVDDGSPDKCPQICDKYMIQDNRVKVIHQKNSGVSAARNAGLAISKGEYIGFVDPDDWVEKDMYGEMIHAMEKFNTDMAICGYDYYDELGNVDESRRYLIRPDEVIDQKEIMNRFSDMPPTIRHGVVNKLFKKKILNNQKFISHLHSSEDVYFLNDYVQKISKAVIVHRPLYNNLVRQGSATHGGLSIKSLADSFVAHNVMYLTTINLYPELKDHSLAFLLDVCTLKYNEAVRKLNSLGYDAKKVNHQYLKQMKKYIRKYAIQAIFDSEIFWKTRIIYIIKGLI